MKSLLVIDRDFFARFYLAQREEQNVVVKRAHVGVGFAAMVDVVRAVAAAGAVQAPASVDIADAQDTPLRARLCASRSEIRSPVYSAIFLPR